MKHLKTAEPRARAGRHRLPLRRPLVAGIAVGLLLASVSMDRVRAAEVQWTGAVSHDWSLAGNWTVPPAPGDDVLIDDSLYSSELAGGQAGVRTLTIGVTGHGRLDVTSGAMLEVSGYGPTGYDLILAKGVGSVGELTVSGNGSLLVVNQTTQIGSAGTGALSVLAGAVADLGTDMPWNEVYVGFGNPLVGPDGEHGSGSIVVDGNGSVLNHGGGMNVFNGSLTVSNGGKLLNPERSDGDWVSILGYGELADADGARPEFSGHGTATVTGAGSAWSSDNLLEVGRGSQGELSILDGGVAEFRQAVSVGVRYTGNAGNGRILVSGDGSRLAVREGTTPPSTAGNLNVGQFGEGWLGVKDGGTADVNGLFTVGNGSRGTVEIDDAGTMVVRGVGADLTGMVLGKSEHGDGSVAIDGPGSELAVSGGARIGSGGIGNLSLANGGKATIGVDAAFSEVTVGFAGLGGGADAAKGSGIIRVDGADSLLFYGGGLHVLNGTMDITDGGSVIDQKRAGDGGTRWFDEIGWGVPAGPDAPALEGVGAVRVAGPHSAWIGNGLKVGRGGQGSLDIVDGGIALFVGSAEIGGISYRTDAASGSPLPGLAGQEGAGAVRVSGSGSVFGVGTALDEESEPGIIDVGVHGEGLLAISDGGGVSVVEEIHVGPRGTVVIGSEEDGSVAGPGEISAAKMTFDAPTSTLVFRHSDDLYLFDNPMSGNGHIDVAAGFTRLTADSSAFIGTTVVGDGATLSINGALGGIVSVSVGGTLEGKGTVGDLTVGGTLAPGNSPGTLHVDGDLLMQSGSVYAAEIDPAAGVSDSVVVEGNVTIEPGVTLQVDTLGDEPLLPGVDIELISLAGDDSTIDGQFDIMTGSLNALLDYDVISENGTIRVNISRSRSSFASFGSSPGTTAVGTALDGLDESSPLIGLLLSQADTSGQVAATLADLYGGMNADLRRVLLDDSRLLRDTVDRHLVEASDGTGPGTGFWVQAMGHWGGADAADDLGKARVNGSGLMVGADTPVGDSTRVGVAIGGGQTSYAVQAQNAHVTHRHLALYGSSTAGTVRVGYGLAGSWHQLESRRRFAIGSEWQLLAGNHDARTAQAFVDAGIRLGAGTRYAEPFASLAYARLHSDAASESGGVAALTTRSGTESATFTTLGMRWNVETDAAQFRGSAGWRHVFGFDRASVQQDFVAGGTGFQTVGLPMAGDALAVDLGMRFAVGDSTHVEAGYAGLLSGSSQDHGARLTLVVNL